jgi:predicted signal transduction protein with EAL and GGDEF domain
VTLNLRVSAGLAVARPGDSIETSVERADVALYAAKRGGRDRWQWHEGAAASSAATPIVSAQTGPRTRSE